jgi:glycosyltransferase involved in cell wall biosynthesis
MTPSIDRHNDVHAKETGMLSVVDPQPAALNRTLPPVPLVSTVIPTYRRAEMVGRAVQTVLAQTYAHVEVIVVDDNTDVDERRRVREALSPFGSRVTVVPNERSKGACGARNTGILHARGELVAFLDDDDLWLPDKLAAQVALLQQGEFVAALCHYIDIDLAFGHAVHCRASRPVLTREQALAGECPTSTSLAVVRHDVLVDAGLFDEALPSFQDFDMWLRCLAFGNFGYVERPLVEFVQHAGDRTSVNIGRRLAGLEAIERKWGDPMSAYGDFAAFKRRVHVDALIANGRASLDGGYVRALRYFSRAAVLDRLSVRSGFWLMIGALGPRWGRALYRRLLSVRRVETVQTSAFGALDAREQASGA